MSQLLDIIENVKLKGHHEEPWNILLNGYFRGDDGFEQIQTWAKSVGLSVSFNNQYQSCTFLAIHNPPTQSPHA
jgi:hypothetical protein